MNTYEARKQSRKNANRQSGFSLIEFVISTVVVAAVLLVSMLVANGMSKQMRSEHNRIGAQDNARVAIGEITRLLRGAGSQTDASRGQNRFLFAGPFTISFNANLTPIDDADGTGLPMAIDLSLTNTSVPLGAGQSYTPARSFATGAETFVLTIDSNRDGFLTSADASDDEEEESDNPRDFVLKTYIYGSDGVANTVQTTGLALLRGPLADGNSKLPAPLFQYWLDDDNDQSTAPVLHGDTNANGELSQAEIASMTPVSASDLAKIERVNIAATAESEKATEADYYESVTMKSSVTFRNRNNTAGRVVGRVFHDNNKNSVQDESEVPLSGIVVRCSNGYATKSNVNGRYSFVLAPGTYSIQEIDPTGYISTTPNTVPVTIGPGEFVEVNFGDVSESGTGFIYGRVFEDLDQNGIRDVGERGMSGIRVFLDTGAFDYSDSSGAFAFSVSVGNYTVTQIDSTGYASSTSNVVDVNVAADGDSAQILFGDYPITDFGTINGLVFFDDDKDGVLDTGEAGIANVSISLGSGEVTVTDVNGEFSFTVVPGPQKVTEQDPPDHTSSTPNTVHTVVKSKDIVYVLFGDIGKQDVSFQEISLGDTERALSITALQMGEDNRADSDLLLGTHFVGGSNDILAWWNQRKNSATPNSAIFDFTPTYQRSIAADVNVVVAVDLNGDGSDDIITGLASNSNNLSVWITSNSGGSMGTLPTTPDARYTSAGLAVRAIVMGNFDGDTYPDMAVGLSSGAGVGRLEIWHGTGGSSFTQSSADRYPTIPGTSISFAEVVSLAKGDFNGDGIDDLAVGARLNSSSSYVVLLMNDPRMPLGQAFHMYSDFPVYGAITDLEVVDMMEDDQNDLDIILTTQQTETTGLIEVWHNDSTNNFGYTDGGTLVPNDTADPGGAPLSLVAIRVDNDIFPDLIVGTRNSSTFNGAVVLYRAFGFLPLNGFEISSLGSGEVVTITSSDFNKDGAPDIAVGTRVSSTAGKVVIYFNEQTAF